MRTQSPSRGFVVSIIVIASAFCASFVSGFDFSRSSIDTTEIVSGGPGKDGIPALTEPNFTSVDEADFLRPGDRVVGVEIGDERKAYPLRILNWHEVVNDTVGGMPIAVTYCPLTASAVVFDRTVKGKTLTFGVSGNLYRSNVLIYDRQSDSLWSQLLGRAVTGSFDRTELKPLPAEVTSWADWRARNPDSPVLSVATGHRRDYGRDPYAEYHSSPGLMFSPGKVDRRLPSKELVVGVRNGKASKAYRLRALPVEGLRDRVGGDELHVLHDPKAERTTVTDMSGKPLPSVVVYWFAWAAFNPRTDVWLGAEHKENSK